MNNPTADFTGERIGGLDVLAIDFPRKPNFINNGFNHHICTDFARVNVPGLFPDWLGIGEKQSTTGRVMARFANGDLCMLGVSLRDDVTLTIAG